MTIYTNEYNRNILYDLSLVDMASNRLWNCDDPIYFQVFVFSYRWQGII